MCLYDTGIFVSSVEIEVMLLEATQTDFELLMINTVLQFCSGVENKTPSTQ